MSARTTVSIAGEQFLINGQPPYLGRYWQGRKIEGLLMNLRLVQGIFDDLNPATQSLWNYPDTGVWDPERNTNEFVAAMPRWRAHGLLAFTLNLQGGKPRPHTLDHPWQTSAITPAGELRADYLQRLERILQRADELGMVVILGVYYFGQDARMENEAAVLRGLDNTVDWILASGYRNVLLEINNECDIRYTQACLKADRVHELIDRAKARTRDGRRLLVSTSFAGSKIPTAPVVRAADYVLLHGNGVFDPAWIGEMARQVRALPGYRAMPLVFNEDDQAGFDRPVNNLTAALDVYASWGFYSQGDNNYQDGWQCPPVNWGIGTAQKKAFFEKVREITAV